MKFSLSRTLVLTLYTIQIGSIYLFFEGYLKVRQELQDVSSPQSSSGSEQKVILILIDAFRADFAVSQNFTFFTRMIESHPNNSLLFLSIADAPTITAQRIQAITSGNLPSFINFHQNFYASDLKNNDKEVVFMGDDTWKYLFPHSFSRSFPFDSFDVSDLNTVDNGVIVNLMKTLDEKDWNMIIGHFLGIDHAGHTYDDHNEFLWNKEKQFSQVLNDVYDKMDEETVLIVIGDHGMTSGGNHGGDSLTETNTVIFGVTKNPNGFSSEFSGQLKEREFPKTFDYSSDLLRKDQYLRMVSQIDLVPTMAALLDVPIPFNNLGKMIPEFLINGWKIKHYCRRNMEQVWKFVQTVQQVQKMYPTSEYNQWSEQKQMVDELDDVEYCPKALGLIQEIQDKSRKLWNEYDYDLMILSLALMILSILLRIQVDRQLYFSNQIEENMLLYKQCLQQENKFIDIQPEIEETINVIEIAAVVLVSIIILSFVFQLNYVLVGIGLGSCLVLMYKCQVKIRYLTKYIQFIRENQIKLKQINEKLFLSESNILNHNFFVSDRSIIGPKHLAKFQFLLYLYMVIEYGFVDLSLMCLRKEDTVLFEILCKVVIIHQGNDMWWRMRAGTQNIKAQAIFSLSAIIGLVLCEQYHIETNREMSIQWNRFLGAEWLFQSLVMQSILPGVILFFVLNKFYSEMREGFRKSSSPVLQTVSFIILLLILCYYVVRADSNILIDLYIPRLVYILSLSGMAASLVMKDQQHTFSIFMLLFILMVSGPNGIAVYACCIVCALLFYKLLQYSIQVCFVIYCNFKQSGVYVMLGVLSLIANYCWVMLGNRSSFNSIKVDSGYIGFKKFNLYITGPLLILNQIGIFILMAIIVLFLSQVIERLMIVDKVSNRECAQKLLLLKKSMLRKNLIKINLKNKGQMSKSNIS